MAFVSKEWKTRKVEYPGRRVLKNPTTGISTTYDVSRAEGEILQEGDAFSSANMNDLEQRVSNEFGKINKNLGNCTFSVQSDGAYVTYTPTGGADAVTKKLGSPEIKTKTVTSLTGSFDAGGTVLFAAVTSLSCRTNTYATKYGHSATVNGSVSYSGNTISWGINQSGDDTSGNLTLYSMTIAYAIE